MPQARAILCYMRTQCIAHFCDNTDVHVVAWDDARWLLAVLFLKRGTIRDIVST